MAEDPKARFIADPLRYAGTEGPPPEWVAEGWGHEAFRDAMAYVLSRSVSKTGGFGLASGYLARRHQRGVMLSIMEEARGQRGRR